MSDFHIKWPLFKCPFLQEVCSSYQRSRWFIELILPQAPCVARDTQHTQQQQHSSVTRDTPLAESAEGEEICVFSSTYLSPKYWRQNREALGQGLCTIYLIILAPSGLTLYNLHSSKLRIQKHSLWSFAVRVLFWVVMTDWKFSTVRVKLPIQRTIHLETGYK